MQAAVSIRAVNKWALARRRISERARRLSGHHLAIGDRQEFGQADGVQRIESGDPNAQGQLMGGEDVAIHQFDGGSEAVQHCAAGFIGISTRENGEFVAANARDDVRFAKGHLQNFGAADQESVPLNVAAVVVSLFEAIHIGKEEKEWLFRTKGQTDVVRAEKKKATPIVQAGQLVGKGHSAELMKNFPTKKNGLRGFQKQLAEFEEIVRAGAWRLGKRLDLGEQVGEFIASFVERISQELLGEQTAGGRPKSSGSSQSSRTPGRGGVAEMIWGVPVGRDRETNSSHGHVFLKSKAAPGTLTSDNLFTDGVVFGGT